MSGGKQMTRSRICKSVLIYIVPFLFVCLLLVALVAFGVVSLEGGVITVGPPLFSVTLPLNVGCAAPPEPPKATIEIGDDYPRQLRPGEVARVTIKWQGISKGADRLETYFENYKTVKRMVYRSSAVRDFKSKDSCVMKINIGDDALPYPGGRFVAEFWAGKHVLIFDRTAEDVEIVPGVSFSYPPEGAIIGGGTVVEGKVIGIPTESTLWLFAKLESELDYYPQAGPITIASDGTWSTSVFTGREPLPALETERVDLMVVLADEEATRVLDNYVFFGEKTGVWLGLAFPSGTIPLEQVTVMRELP